MEEQVKSSMFVGRSWERKDFRQLLEPDSKIRILHIHTKGEGGIGKTRLLKRMQEDCQQFPNVFCVKDFIDFYDTESHSKHGVMRQIVANLGSDNFLGFNQKIQASQMTQDASKRPMLIGEAEEDFWREFNAFAGRVQQKKRLIVLFFDTYEVVQNEIIHNGIKEAETTEFSHWLETEFFVKLTKANVRLVVSGRYALQEFPNTSILSVIPLTHFSFSETKDFWQRCFPDSNLNDKIGPDVILQKFHTLADGRPILLALFVDWLNYERNPLNPVKFLEEIEQEAGTVTQSVTAEQKQLFEKKLIVRLESLIEPENKVVRYMAVVYRRMTPQLLHTLLPDIPMETTFQLTEKALDDLRENIPQVFLEKLDELKDRAYPTKEAFCLDLQHTMGKAVIEQYGTIIEQAAEISGCRDILCDKLKDISFIKYKEPEVVLLHDEMRRLILEYWWKPKDEQRIGRKDIAKRTVAFYDEKILSDTSLSQEKHELYTSEVLEYALLADASKGLARFTREFDLALDDGKYNYCELLLREAERYHLENPGYLPFPDCLNIQLRQFQYHNEIVQQQEQTLRLVRETIEKYRENKEWEDSVLSGRFLLEYGIAAFNLEYFGEAQKNFEKATRVFYNLGEDSWMYWATNWLGYTCYRKGSFQEAEQFLNNSREGFYQLLSYPRGDVREVVQQRYLLQGFQVSLGNLAIVYGYTGRTARAIRKAEINLNMARWFQNYNLEIARACATAGRIALWFNDKLNANRYLKEAEGRLQESPNRVLQGRIKTDLAFLQYRMSEFTYLLEYYRAEEIEQLIEVHKDILSENVKRAKHLIFEAIKLFEKPPVIKKELQEAYYMLGKLYMVDPSPDHWQKAQETLERALRTHQSAMQTGFQYGLVETLESLMTLCYFWEGAAKITPISQNPPSIQSRLHSNKKNYQHSLTHFGIEDYPELHGKYQITAGNEQFDEALRILCAYNEEKNCTAMDVLKKAFSHYVEAVKLMKAFNEDRYYLALRVFYNRFKTLLTEERKGRILKISGDPLNALRQLWQQDEDVQELDDLYVAMMFRILPAEEMIDELDELHNRIKEKLDAGHTHLASLLNACLIELYRLLSPADQPNDEYLEPFLLQMNAQANFYRSLQDDYQADETIRIIRKELETLQDQTLKQAVEGYTDGREGTLKYRRGEYVRLLEMFLQDDLDIWCKRFDKAFPNARYEALNLLKAGEKKIETAISCWEERLKNTPDKNSSKRLHDYRKQLGELRFRLGELLMLQGQFDDYPGENGPHKGSLRYFQEAIEDTKSGKDWYRYDDAVQSYLNALYFAGRYDHPEYSQQRQKFEQELEKEQRYPSIRGRFRIMQGDVLFSQYFQQVKEEDGGYYYVRKEDNSKVKTIRAMWRRYVEACNFMAQHSAKNFSATVQVLLRRLQLIADPHALQVIRQGLRNVWNDQPYLKDKQEEMRTLIQFANIRSIIVQDENQE